MLGRGVIVGGLLLFTGLAGAQVLQRGEHAGIDRDDPYTPVAMPGRDGAHKISDFVRRPVSESPARFGRINIRDEDLAADAVDDIRMSKDQPPTCQWDCEPVPDKEVGINDFLALLSQWGGPGPCDFDGGGVGINDFLKLLANWGPCPTPINDECAGKIFIDRTDPNGSHTEAFDMYGATPSPDPSQCLPAGIQAKDIWYCLVNATNEEKVVTLAGTVDLLAEVTAGCACVNPGPLVACGRLVAAAPTSFPMQAGEQVCIRLHNDLDLPNDIIKGDLVITNEAVPPSEKCFDQPPNQASGILSDLNCDQCIAGGGPPQQLVAEQLILTTAEGIDELRFWGGYFPGDAGGGSPPPDDFTVKFRLNDDSSGTDLPGPVTRKLQIGPATTRSETGVFLFGVREFEYTVNLEPNQDLPAGHYWIEIYSDTSNGPLGDDWFWELGTLDAVNGQTGSAYSTDPPNVVPKTWSAQFENLSLNILCKPDDPPGTVRFDEDPADFAGNLPPTKVTKLDWDFKPDNVAVGSILPLQDPIDINTHAANAPGIWSNPDVWPADVDNVQFASNNNPGGPYGPGAGLLYHKGPTAQLLHNNNALVAEEIPTPAGDTSFTIFSGPPAGDNHTAFEMELVSATPGTVAVMEIAVYDKQENVIGSYSLTMLPTEKRYLGMVATVTIGRIDIWDSNGGEEGISSITAWQDDTSNPFGCPGAGDCCDPAGNGSPGCSNTDCCRLVCAADPFCCDVDGTGGFWDAVCAQTALQFPQCQCPPIHEIDACLPPDCPSDLDPVWCIYQVTDVQGDLGICAERGIFIFATVCMTPCPSPDDVNCDPEGTGVVTFRTLDNGCQFRAAVLGGCERCLPGSTKWTRVN